MAYSSYCTNIDDSVIKLETFKSTVEAIDISSSWTGNASDKHKTSMQGLMSDLSTQCSQLTKLSGVLKLIDEYDEAKSNVESYRSTLNSLDSKAKNYKDQYNHYSGLLSSAESKKSSLAEQIREGLNSIETRYTEQYSDIAATEVVTTSDMFKIISEFGAVIDESLDMSKTVVPMSPISQDKMNPNFDNLDAWVNKNPYAGRNTGQCTWFAWGRFYEIYGYSPGFTGNGNDCAGQLLRAHGDKFYKSSEPVPGAVFSQGLNEEYGHVGIVLDVDKENNTITIQDGNKNGSSDSFAVAQTDWGTATYPLDEWCRRRGGAVFACPIT